MRLVEVIAGARSDERGAGGRPRRRRRAWASHVIDAVDGPGFLVNRCNRPFNLEALRLVAGAARHAEQVDRIVRWRRLPDGPVRAHGPRRARRRRSPCRSPSTSQSFGEPRWRPSPRGRADGRRRAARPQDRRGLVRRTRTSRRTRSRPSAGGGRRPDRRRRRDRAGAGAAASAAAEAGWDVADAGGGRGRRARALIVDCGADGGRAAAAGRPAGPAVRHGAARRPRPRRRRAPASSRCRRSARLVELTRSPTHVAARRPAAERFFALARPPRRVGRRRARARARPDRLPSSSTRRASPSARASARPRTSTPACVLGLNHPRGRSSGPTRSAPPRCSPSSTGCTTRRRGALPRRASAAAAGGPY